MHASSKPTLSRLNRVKTLPCFKHNQQLHSFKQSKNSCMCQSKPTLSRLNRVKTLQCFKHYLQLYFFNQSKNLCMRHTKPPLSRLNSVKTLPCFKHIQQLLHLNKVKTHAWSIKTNFEPFKQGKNSSMLQAQSTTALL